MVYIMSSYTEASSQVDEDEEDVEEERKRVYSANGNDYLQLQAVTKVADDTVYV